MDVPELIVINKADAADPIDLDALRRQEPRSMIVSARTGEGLDALVGAVEAALPQWDREVSGRRARTCAATWWPGPIRRVRCSRSGTARLAPS